MRVNRDQGRSIIAALMKDASDAQLVEEHQQDWYAGAPEGWSVLTLSYLVSAVPQDLSQ
jgi:hypothetical protein